MGHFPQILGYLVIFTSITSTTSSRSSYGEPCSRNLRCDTKAMLTCSNDICKCLMADSMIFDEESNKCVTLAGEKCVYTAAEGDRSWSEQVPCISNSLCLDGICTCDLDYFELGNGSCSEKSIFGETCSKKDKLNMCKNHLICGDNRTCICEDNRVYDQIRQTCVLFAGKVCSPGIDDDCVENAFCTDQICSCVGDYFHAENGFCELRRDYGRECLSDEMCQTTKFLKCLTQDNETFSCFCESGRLYDQSRQSCRIKALHACERGSHDCVKHAVCAGGDSSSYHDGLSFDLGSYSIHKFLPYECSCESGTYATIQGSCKEEALYGESCDNEEKCNEKFHLRCDSSTGTCKCNSQTVVDPVRKICVGREQSRCHLNQGTCVPNAYCVDRYSWSRICECVGAASKSIRNDGYCYIKENEECNTNVTSFDEVISKDTDICLPGLVCSNRTCSCFHRNHQFYDSSSEKCFSLVGGPCKDTSGCGTNMECVNEGGINVCRCKSRFSPINRKCEYLAYGEICSKSDRSQICDRLPPLECSVRGKCECIELQIYNEERRTCRGLVGAKCSIKNPNFCVDGAICKLFWGEGLDFGSCACKLGFAPQQNRTCIADGSSGNDGVDVSDKISPI